MSNPQALGPRAELFDPSYDHLRLEAEAQALWDDHQLYAFNPHGDGPVFAVDTPPPYVSAAHLHVGHAMSYTQAEALVRWQRMRGARCFYPMGFDDNGLPTERYVEQTYDIDKSSITRSDFRARCLEETTRGAASYEALWRRLGLSVDWSLRYSTIDEHCQRTSQRSFLELLAAGHIYRAEEPVLWDPELRSSVAQADVQTLQRRQKLHTLHFFGPSGALPISTTRPELLMACVALYHHPEDARFQGLTSAQHPLDDRQVPVLTDADVDPEFGTGLMMVCTFGDADDVRRWRRDKLPTRLVIGPDGRLNEAAGPYAGLRTTEARARVLADLKARDAYAGFAMTEQALPIGERSSAPIEWQLAPQWFLSLLDRKEALRERSNQLQWRPSWMKARLDQWIDGLQWDWNLSRQRFYGVPVPMWLCTSCEHAVPANIDDLPVDPLEQAPPVPVCPACGGALRGDPDVLDTWMTSSMTPQINSNWAGTPGRTPGPFPMHVRVQGFEIIRTWLFYSLVKSDLHADALPWSTVMISGWGLNEQGKKISKRDLVQSTDAEGHNRYDPHAVIERFGADALRHWACRGHLGHDVRYHTKNVRNGRRVVVKLWNAARLAALSLEDFEPSALRSPIADRPVEDRALFFALDRTIETVHEAMEAMDPGAGLETLDRFFFGHFCDEWLEIFKDRDDAVARATLYDSLRDVVGLYAPYVPFVTEAVWQRLYRDHEEGPSLHVREPPSLRDVPAAPAYAMVRDVMKAARAWRTERRIPQRRYAQRLALGVPDAAQPQLTRLAQTLRAACRAEQLVWEPGEHTVPDRPGWTLRLDLEDPS